MKPPLAATTITLTELIELRRHTHEIPLFSTPQRRSVLVGLHHSRLRGRGVDFDQVRIYQAGDDVRHIDWRVTARTQEPHTKLFHEERERPIYLLIEQSQRLFFGTQTQFKSVLVAQAAALIGWAALKHNDRIGGLVFGETDQHGIRPRRTQRTLLQLLECVARTHQQLQSQSMHSMPPATDSVGLALRRARDLLRPGSLAILLCDERALNETVERQLKLLARHTDLLLVPVSDPIDHALPAAGYLAFTEHDAYLSLNTHDQRVRQSYRAHAQKRQQNWRHIARRLGVPLLPLSTQYTAVEQLHQHLTTYSGTPL